MANDFDTLTIHPYLHDECWVFDDERTGLKEEAFVLGATDMITRVVAAKGIPHAERGFALTFSGSPFAGHDVELRWLRSDPAGGDWYEGDVVGQRMEAWLCPALLLYFRSPPPRIFVCCDALPPGINPIWTPPAGAASRQFVKPTDRFYVSTHGMKIIDGYRLFRSVIERMAAAKGKTLEAGWYEDGPDQKPYLYKDQPHLLEPKDPP